MKVTKVDAKNLLSREAYALSLKLLALKHLFENKRFDGIDSRLEDSYWGLGALMEGLAEDAELLSSFSDYDIQGELVVDWSEFAAVRKAVERYKAEHRTARISEALSEVGLDPDDLGLHRHIEALVYESSQSGNYLVPREAAQILMQRILKRSA